METSSFKTTALTLTLTEAERLIARVRHARFLADRDIAVYMQPADPMVMEDGTSQLAVYVKVDAPSPMAIGMGIGFLVAISEGIVK